jgi:hypothetical protein
MIYSRVALVCVFVAYLFDPEILRAKRRAG